MADSGNHFYYYLYNLQGDVIALADASTGKLVVTYTYDAWGKLMELKDTTANSVGTLNPFRYKGYYYDTETGLYYLNSRYYDAETGRFINADGQLNSGVLGYNMFAYCENNAVNGSDPDGDMVWWVAAALGGAAFEVASYLIGNAIRGQKSTWKGAAKAALTGAITGVALGAVGKGIQAVGKAAKAFVNSTKATAKGIQNGVAIGEKMGARVEPFAKANNLDTYSGLPNYDKLVEKTGKCISRKIGMWHNKLWINNQVKSGVKVFDVGPAGSEIVSEFYAMERKAVKGYCNYFRCY